MKRRVVIKKLQYVLESTIKKRRKNMKLKKILAQSLAVAMVLSSIPVSGFHVSAMENDILTSSNQGYQNIDLVASGDDANVTVTPGSAQACRDS